MRITESLIQQTVRLSNTSARDVYFDKSETLARGKKIASPSEGLVDAQAILTLENSLKELEHFNKTRVSVESDLVSQDDVLYSAIDILTEVKTIALQMSNDAVNPDARIAQAENVTALRNELVDLMNTQRPDGRFIFSGTAESTEPYTETGVYQGNLGQREVELTPGFFIQSTTSGPDVMGTPSAIEMMGNFIGALQANDLAGIQTAIDDFENAIHTAALAHTSNGGRLAHVKNAQQTLEEIQVQVQTQHAELQNVDLAVAITEMTAAEQAMTVVIEVTQDMMDNSVLRWLR